MQDESTDSFEFPAGEEYHPTSLELMVSGPGGENWRLPLTRQTTRIAEAGRSAHLELAGSPTLMVSWMQQQLILWCDRPVEVNGRPRKTTALEVNDEIRWDGYSARLVDRANSLLATLECISTPYLARIWPIDGETTLIGRRGGRRNHVELEHSTISRNHATLVWGSRGARIRCDTGKSVVAVEGRPLPSAAETDLVDGALVQFGELTFRFRLLKEGDLALRGPRLNVCSLGPLLVFRGHDAVAEKSWRTSNVRWLLGRLALDWGRPVPIELLLELFWPDMTVASSKNNLNFSLSTLRAILRSEEYPAVDYLLRTRTTLQLNPELLGEHDHLRLQEALSGGRQLANTARAGEYWKKAIELYRGPYLEGCFLEWAQEVRHRLHLDVLEAGRALLKQLLAEQEWDQVAHWAPQVLGLDPCCQASASAFMQAQIERGNAHDAFRIYEACLQSLSHELGVSPGPELKALHERALECFTE